MYYYGARYYNSGLGRFIQTDPLIQNVYDPQSLNHFAYCRNSPLVLTDPDGTSWTNTWSSLSNTWSNWPTGISNSWNNFNSWVNTTWQNTVQSSNQAWQDFKNSSFNSINALTTNAMQSFSSFNSGVYSVAQTAMKEAGMWVGNGIRAQSTRRC
ncbi:MAG: RHS repeat-associated core domain-containing protein [Candidatus Omnitrophota bacterium]